MEIYNKKSISEDLKIFDHLANEDSFIEISEWKNGEGVDIFIENNGSKSISLTFGELNAIHTLANMLDYGIENVNNKIDDK